MKKILFLVVAIILFPSIIWAATDVTFAWDPNIESDIDGYRLYQSDESDNYNADGIVADVKHVDVCSEEECQTTISVEDGQWFWVATAYDTHGNESDYSNEVSESLDSTPPEPPSGFLIKLKQVVAMIVNWFMGLFA